MTITQLGHRKTEVANQDESVAEKQKVLIVEVKFKLSINGRVTEGGGDVGTAHSGASRCAARSSQGAHTSGVVRAPAYCVNIAFTVFFSSLHIITSSKRAFNVLTDIFKGQETIVIFPIGYSDSFAWSFLWSCTTMQSEDCLYFSYICQTSII